MANYEFWKGRLMATKAQIAANRRNAEKSTGPRTDEGKAAVAQNAVKHGLSGRVDVIKGEDQAEFERHRQALLAELKPRGVVETLLAERAASLSWRLKRVDRMHNEVIDVLLDHEATPLARQARSTVPGKAAQEDGLDLGRATIRDFANGRVLDRLMMYERRTEHSLLKTFNDLQLRRLRVREYISRHMDEIGDPQGGSLKSEWSDGESSELQTSHFQLQTSSEPSAGVTTNMGGEADADRMSAPRRNQYSSIPSCQSSSDAPIPSFPYSTDGPDEAAAAELSCKTKPISPRTNGGQVPWSEEVTADSWHDDSRETNPMREGGFETCPCERTPDNGAGAAMV
jgi:hypothetical protein